MAEPPVKRNMFIVIWLLSLLVSSTEVQLSEECPSNSCQNGGTCMYTCTCTAGFSGQNCENDVASPHITCPENESIEYPNDLPNTKATATDNSGQNTQITSRKVISGSPPTETITLEWTAKDAAGNKAMCKTTYTYQDTTHPVITTCPPSALLEYTSPVQIPETRATAQDSSGLNVAVSVTDSLNGDPPHVIATRVWMAEDTVGLSSTCTTVYMYHDTTPPIINYCPPDEKFEYNKNHPHHLPIKNATSSDGSGLKTTMAVETCIKGLKPNISVTWSWTARDKVGLTATCKTTYAYYDTTPPVITCPPNATFEYYENYPSQFPNTNATATDGSGLRTTMSVKRHPVEGTIPNITVTWTWTVKDTVGLTDSCTTTYQYTYHKCIDVELQEHCTANGGAFSKYSNSCFNFTGKRILWSEAVTYCLGSAPQGYRGRLPHIPNSQVWDALRTECDGTNRKWCWAGGYALTPSPSAPFNMSEWGWIDHFPNGSDIIIPMESLGLVAEVDHRERCTVLYAYSLSDHYCLWSRFLTVCEYLKEDGNFCDVSECISGPCQNGGTCLEGANRYSCSCAPEFTGENCEMKKR